MKLEPVADYLEAQGLGVKGTSLFINEMPAGKNGILLLDNLHGTHIDHNLPGYYRGGFRIAVRSTEYAAGDTLARQAIAKLTFYGDFTMGSLQLKSMLPQNLPHPYRRSAGALWEFEVDVDAYFVET